MGHVFATRTHARAHARTHARTHARARTHTHTHSHGARARAPRQAQPRTCMPTRRAGDRVSQACAAACTRCSSSSLGLHVTIIMSRITVTDRETADDGFAGARAMSDLSQPGEKRRALPYFSFEAKCRRRRASQCACAARTLWRLRAQRCNVPDELMEHNAVPPRHAQLAAAERAHTFLSARVKMLP